MHQILHTGLGLPPALACLVLVGAYGACDRLWGAAHPSFKGKKALLFLIVLVSGLAAAGLCGLLLGVLWLVYRAVGFAGGAGAPETGGQRLAAFVRHGLVVPGAALVGLWTGRSPAQFAVAFGAYAVAATGLAIVYGELTLKHKRSNEAGGFEGKYVEMARGAAYGLAVFAATLFIP